MDAVQNGVLDALEASWRRLKRARKGKELMRQVCAGQYYTSHAHAGELQHHAHAGSLRTASQSIRLRMPSPCSLCPLPPRAPARLPAERSARALSSLEGSTIAFRWRLPSLAHMLSCSQQRQYRCVAHTIAPSSGMASGEFSYHHLCLLPVHEPNLLIPLPFILLYRCASSFLSSLSALKHLLTAQVYFPTTIPRIPVDQVINTRAAADRSPRAARDSLLPLQASGSKGSALFRHRFKSATNRAGYTPLSRQNSGILRSLRRSSHSSPGLLLHHLSCARHARHTSW